MKVQYDKLNNLKLEDLKAGTIITVLFNDANPDSTLTSLLVEEKEPGIKFLSRVEVYDSIKEFSTVSMKELLTLYAKRAIIDSDKEYYKHDDPKLHAYISKLSYPGIEAVCNNLSDFSHQFKEGTVTLNIPKFGKKKK
jgi:hypothetical protein